MLHSDSKFTNPGQWKEAWLYHEYAEKGHFWLWLLEYVQIYFSEGISV